MAEITDSFCERCGTHYTFEDPQPKKRLGKTRLLAKAARNFVLSDGTSVSDALEAARHEELQETSNAFVSQFHSTFNFCMSCRQYTCEKCWNEEAGACLTCVPAVWREEIVPPPQAADRTHPAPAVRPSILEWPAADLDRRAAASAGNGHLDSAVAEPSPAPVEAVAEPIAKPTAEESVAEAVAEPVAEAVAEPVAESVAEAVAAPVAEAVDQFEATEPEPAAVDAVGEPAFAEASTDEVTDEQVEALIARIEEVAAAVRPEERVPQIAESAAAADEGDLGLTEEEWLLATRQLEATEAHAHAAPPAAVSADAFAPREPEEDPEAILTAEEFAEIAAHFDVLAPEQAEDGAAATAGAEPPIAQAPVFEPTPVAEVAQPAEKATDTAAEAGVGKPHGLFARFLHRGAAETSLEPAADAATESTPAFEPQALWPTPTPLAASVLRGTPLEWEQEPGAPQAGVAEAVEPAEGLATEAEPQAAEGLATEAEPQAAEVEAVPSPAVEPAVVAEAPPVEQAVVAEAPAVEPVAPEPAATTPAVEPEAEPAAALAAPEAEPAVTVVPAPAPQAEPVVAIPAITRPTTPAPVAKPTAWPMPQATPLWPAPQQPAPPAQPPARPSAPAPWPVAAATSEQWADSARQVLARPAAARACRQCALPISTSARFCRRCGTRQDVEETVGAGQR